MFPLLQASVQPLIKKHNHDQKVSPSEPVSAGCFHCRPARVELLDFLNYSTVIVHIVLNFTKLIILYYSNIYLIRFVLGCVIKIKPPCYHFGKLYIKYIHHHSSTNHKTYFNVI